MKPRVRSLMVFVAISAIIVAIAIDFSNRLEHNRLAFYRNRALERASNHDRQQEFCLANEGNRAYDKSRAKMLAELLSVGSDHPRTRFETWAAEAGFHREQAATERYVAEQIAERMGMHRRSMLFP